MIKSPLNWMNKEFCLWALKYELNMRLTVWSKQFFLRDKNLKRKNASKNDRIPAALVLGTIINLYIT